MASWTAGQHAPAYSRFAKRTRFCVTLAAIVATAVLTIGCERTGNEASSRTGSMPDGATQHSTGKAPPIPEAGELARSKSLQQVGTPIDFTQDPYLDADIQPLALTERDIDDLVAFLASLTSADYKEQAVNELARQGAISRTTRPQRDTARAFGPKPVQPEPHAAR